MTEPRPEHPLHTRAGRRASTREEVHRFETIEDTAIHVLTDPERANLIRAGHPSATVGRRYDQRGRPKRIHPDGAKKHGTRGCHDNWGCRCAWVPGTGPWVWWPEGAVIPLAAVANIGVKGCERVAVEAVRNTRERRNMDAPTVPIVLRKVAAKRTTGKHQKPRDSPPPAGSAFTQLANSFLPTTGAQPA